MRGIIVASVALSGCSLFTFDQSSCTSNVRCRDAFGLGSTCSTDGFCEAFEPFERCSSTVPEDLFSRDYGEEPPVIFGAIFSRSVVRWPHDAARLAVVQASALGGLGGRPIGLVQCDSGEGYDDGRDTLTAMAESARWLADVAGVVAIVGPGLTDGVEAVWEVVENRDVVVISPGATSAHLTYLDGDVHSDETPGRLWRTIPSDSLQGEVLAADIIARGHLDIGVIYAEDTYGEGLSSVVTAALGEHVLESVGYSDPTQLPDVLQGLGDAEPDALVMLSTVIDDDVSFLGATAVIGGLDGAELFFTELGTLPQVLQAAVEAGVVERVRGSRPSYPEGRVFEAFFAGMSAEYPEMDAHGGLISVTTYDAMWLALYGAAWAHYQGDVQSADDLGRGLRRLSDGEAIEVRTSTWPDIQRSFEAGQSIDIIGASGVLDYDPITEEATGPIEIWTVEVVDGLPQIVAEYVVTP